ncbi:MAG: LacI family DNA-binding transcriptional regulator [Chthonomonas sp.]|nr:LacI family DNA-binding transcriptional regulator [Chthonomonas sp.]
MKRITLADVAKEAGVSVQTASHVMAENLTVRLPESTRQRVREAAAKLGYQPNRLARAMKTGRTNVLSLWMPVDRANPAYMVVVKYLSRFVREAGYELNIVGLSSDVAYGAERTMPTTWPVDGMIVFDAGRAVRIFREDPMNQRIPTVIIGLEEFENCDTCAWDVAGGVRGVVQGLISQGRKRIAYLAPRWVLEDYPNEQRRTGYRTALETVKRPELLIPTTGESTHEAELAIRDFLAHNDPPDAIFGFLDPLALGAVRELDRQGIRVPVDCAIWGYGNFPESEQSRVPLSTINAPLEALIRQAVLWITDRINHPDRESRVISLDLEVHQRESSIPLRLAEPKAFEAGS